MGSMAKASYRDSNGLGEPSRDLDLALYFIGGPGRLQGFHHGGWRMVEHC